MKIIRKLMANQFFVMFMACCVFLVSCKKQEIIRADQTSSNQLQSNDSNKSVVNQTYSGEELFRQILLMENNKNGNNIPQYTPFLEMISKLSLEQQKMRMETIDQIVNGVNKIDGKYFDHFKEVIYSNDPYKIDQELKNAANIVMAVSALIPEKGKVLEASQEIAKKIAGQYDLTNPNQAQNFKAEVINLLGKDFSEYNVESEAGRAGQGKCLLLVVLVAVAAVGVLVAVVDGLWVRSFRSGIEHATGKDLENDQLVLSIIKQY